MPKLRQNLPRPHWGSSQRSPDPLAACKGGKRKWEGSGKEGRKSEGREMEGREREGNEREGSEKKGRS